MTCVNLSPAFARTVLIALLSMTGAIAHAQSYPSRPVRIIVPWPGNDLEDRAARIVVKQLVATSGRAFAVDNNPGDYGHFGAELVAKAQPDGYTLLFAPVVSYAAAASLHAKLHYDLIADFTPVTLIANAPHVLIAHPSLPAQSVPALIAVAKAGPGRIRWATHGRASHSQLELEMFRGLSGIRIESMPFDEGTALPALLVGNAELLFESIAAALPHIKSGRVRALAVAGSKRSLVLRGLPTVAQAGIKGFAADNWFGILAPEGVDESIVSRLNGDFARAVSAVEVRERLMSYGMETRSSTPAELAAIMRDEIAKWARVIKSAGLKPD